MNLILFFPEDFVGKSRRVRLSGRRFEHVREILKARLGDPLCVGLAGGKIGRGKIVKMSADSLDLDVTLDEAPPPPIPVTLILALPRPPVIRRALQSATALGIKKIILLNFCRVEKSFWNSSALKPEAIREQLILGLEQARDTVMPEVVLRPRFKPFVEDELPSLIQGATALVAHPGADKPCPVNVHKPITLLIGPEGGIIPFELDLLQRAGFQTISLGQRILKTETALIMAISRLNSDF